MQSRSTGLTPQSIATKRDNLRVSLAGKTVATAQLAPLLFHGRDESLQSLRHAHVSKRRWRMSAATSHFRSASTAASNWPTFQSTRSLWAPKLSRCSRTGKKARRMPPKLNWLRTASPLLCTDGQSVSMSVRLGADWLECLLFDAAAADEIQRRVHLG